MGREFPRALLEDLRCPYCGSNIRPILEVASSPLGLEHGVLRCDCYEYPVVEGIPVLRQISPVASIANEAVERLRKRDLVGARQWLMEAGRAPGVPQPTAHSLDHDRHRRWLDRLRGHSAGPQANDRGTFEESLRATRPGVYADYLYQRFANPSFLAAVPSVVILGDHHGRSPRRRLLEILCGIGHLSATVTALCPETEVVATDIDFVNLSIARRFLAPNSVAMCLDVEVPLPFASNTFDGLYCLDGLHYVRSKTSLLREADRVVSDEDGVWLFAHMHNAAAANVNAGAPLDAYGYAARFVFGEQRLVPEAAILRGFRSDGSVDLTGPADKADVESSNALTLFGGRNDALWHRHERLDEALGRRPDLLWFNPLYHLERSGDELVATAKWPSDALRAECSVSGSPVPELVHLRAGTVAEITAAKRSGYLSERVCELLCSSVLVSLPECYSRPERLL